LGGELSIIKIVGILRKEQDIFAVLNNSLIKDFVHFMDTSELKYFPFHLQKFYTLMKNIREIKDDPKWTFILNGRKVVGNLWELFNEIFRDYSTLYQYILQGYFSIDYYSLFQRIITFLDVLMMIHQYKMGITEASSENVMERASSYIPDDELSDLFYEQKYNIGRLPILITRKSLEIFKLGTFPFAINFKKILAEDLISKKEFTQFFELYFSNEAQIQLWRRYLSKNPNKDHTELLEKTYPYISSCVLKAERKVLKELEEDFPSFNLNDKYIGRVLIDVLGHVRVLNLEDCQFNDFPNSLMKLTQLRCLNLNKNKNLKELPKFLGELRFLEILRLSGTDIESLPVSLKKTKTLKEVDLGVKFIGNQKGLKELLKPFKKTPIDFYTYHLGNYDKIGLKRTLTFRSARKINVEELFSSKKKKAKASALKSIEEI